MYKILLSSILIFFTLTVCTSQSFEGAWKLESVNGVEASDREVIKIVVDGYFSLGSKSLADHSFLGAAGGEFKLVDSKFIEKRDFDTYDDSKVGKLLTYDYKWLDEQTLEYSSPTETKVWKRISQNDNELDGNWVITGREREGKLNKMTPGDRRTIKILNGDRFQWVAFNSATKSFMGTGGGIYTSEDGVYVEQITFFSRDRDRVGDSLHFEYDIINNEWHHQGKSSKGQPIHEIWSPYAEAYPTDFSAN